MAESVGKKEVIAVSNSNLHTERYLSGLMAGKIALRPFNGTAAATIATVVSGGLPVQQGADTPAATTSFRSEVYSEVQKT
jgi:hypothetical protein